MVHYFGAGPLSRAYLKSFKDAFLKTKKKLLIKYKNIKIKVDYSKYDMVLTKLSQYISTSDIIVINTIFLDYIELDLDVNEHIVDEIKSIGNL